MWCYIVFCHDSYAVGLEEFADLFGGFFCLSFEGIGEDGDDHKVCHEREFSFVSGENCVTTFLADFLWCQAQFIEEFGVRAVFDECFWNAEVGHLDIVVAICHEEVVDDGSQA